MLKSKLRKNHTKKSVKFPITDYKYEGFFNIESFKSPQPINLSANSKNKNFAKFIGYPKLTENSIILSGGNGLDTGIKDNKDLTFFSIFRKTSHIDQKDNKSFIVGTSYGTAIGNNKNTYGTALIANSNKSLSFQCSRGNSIEEQITGSVTLDKLDLNEWNLVWVKCSDMLTTICCYNKKIETSHEFNCPRLLQSENIKIGTNSGLNSGIIEIFNTVIFNRALNDNEVETVCEILKKQASEAKITL
ncbi:hypothetical protein [Acinetobacter soli]|uniref:hypothetical protein n=1 Tax=Acinetobacter soli TaxID=487316 RepID=UPI00370C8689